MVQLELDLLVLFTLALGPGIFWVWYFYQRDRYEPEPAYLILRMFLLGIAVTFPVAFIEGLIAVLVASPLFLAAIVAPIVEEYGKYFVVRRFVYRDREFNEPMDGIVYATAAALGFASLENVIYIFSAYALSPAAALGTVIIRALFSVPAHALFASIWGYALGRAKFSPPEQRQGIVVRGLVLAMVLHGVFNFLLISAEVFAVAMLIFVLVLVPGMWILVNRNIGRALRQGRR
ncbi:PrsW family intramembrane metalloprotease [Methanoculleus sp. FWC-SCC1]|uniref:Protease PrsW n=2 Tax=Methanoculleus frigidifontis TaxID=2584085 RepID=A0ABT8M695_9EURY|nr:PrsW family intramembrane metalloprotease [Methanoculleus sp. FWC-SCC1]